MPQLPSLTSAAQLSVAGNTPGVHGTFGAVEYLRPAVELWPEEPAYQAALGWALFKKMPSEPEDARLHLERAYELDSQDAQTLFWLGTVLKAAGDTVAASNLLNKAQQLDTSLA